IDMIDLFGNEEVYNEEYEVEYCYVHRNSPKQVPCKKCDEMTTSIIGHYIRHAGKYRSRDHYQRKRLKKMAYIRPEIKKN
ncbi:36648_t:CDS:1, partial [Gigaspora margarita]